MFKQDLLIAWRSGFFVVVLALAVLLAGAVNYLFPEAVSFTANEYVVDHTPGGLIETELKKEGRTEHVLPSEQALLARLEEDSRGVGLVFSGTAAAPETVLYLQGYEPESSVNALKAAVDSLWLQAGAGGQPSTHQLELLRPESSKPPFNLSLIPVVLFTEVISVGFIFAAVMVLEEKTEGSVEAYRVAPSGAWLYITSKSAVNVLLAVIYALAVILMTLGWVPAVPQVLLITALASLLVTLFGLWLSTYFNSLSDFMYVLIVFSIVLGLPVAAYFVPAFKLKVLELIPSYQLMFSVRELLFPSGKAGFLQPLVSTLAAETLVVLGLCKWGISRRLLKEAV
jgi:ABC-2 type transport system permease protein/fluoroquinolone transport system permease protein